MTLMTGVCAWHSCTEEGFPLSTDPQTGRLIRLPACETHRKKFETIRNLYKRFGDVAMVFQERSEKANSAIRKLFYLVSAKEAKAQELKARLKQTNSIKPEYTDDEHLFYMKKIGAEIEGVDGAIKTLMSTNAPAKGSHETFSESADQKDSPAGSEGMSL